jgi:hypothetical protein
MRDWLLRHWTRTCAVQCCRDQRSFDKLIPMYKLDGDSDSQDGRVSFILISDEPKDEETAHYLDPITPQNGNIPDLNQPYIAIHADMRTKRNNLSFETTGSEGSTSALRIYAPGIHPGVYSFLNGVEMSNMVDSLQNILDASDTAEQLPSCSAFLRNQVLYGDTVDTNHMRWEAGREKLSRARQ